MQRTQPTATHRWWKWVVTTIALYGVYLMYTANVSTPELIAGAGAAVIATFAAGIFGFLGTVKFHPTFREFLEAWRLPWYLVQGTYEILHGLVLQMFTRGGAPSLVRATPYDSGGDDPHSAGRRALAVGYTTATPNFIVLGIIHKQRLMLYHQILPGEVLQMTMNLGAQQ